MAMFTLLCGLMAFTAPTLAQQVGTNQAEVHPPFTTYECTAGGGCTPDTSTSIVLDSQWRWTHKVGSDTNCFTGDEWDAGICEDVSSASLRGQDTSGCTPDRIHRMASRDVQRADFRPSPRRP